MAKKKINYNFLIIAMIACVAIVAIAGMIFNTGIILPKGDYATNETNLLGEAAITPPQENPTNIQQKTDYPTGSMINRNTGISSHSAFDTYSDGKKVQGAQFKITEGYDVIVPEYEGYIIELKEQPLFKKMNEIKQKNIASTTVNLEIQNQKQRLDSEHTQAKQNIQAKLGKSINAKIKNEYKNIFNGIALDITDAEALQIKQLAEVKNVYPNAKVYANLMDSVPLIGANNVWAQGYTGQGMKIAIVDTGIDYTHPDLGGCLGPSCKVVYGYDFVNNDDDPMDDHGHGTHCAAIAAGNGALKGVAPDAKLYAYKVLDSGGSGYFSDVIAGIEMAVDPNYDGNFSDRADVISLSLGGPGDPDDPVSTAVDNAVDAGVVVAVAAGNSGPATETIGSPGTARKAITVGATDKNDLIAYFSSRGPVKWSNNIMTKPDVVAPGVSICSAQYDSAWNDYKCFDDKHVAISGTSMATPHVAGAAALIKQAHPDWTPEEIKQALRSTAVNLGENIDTQGYGRINVLAAINYQGVPAIAEIRAQPIAGTSEVDIFGTASGREFARYELYYGGGSNPVNWILITQGTTPIVNGTLYSSFDTNLLEEGANYLSLVVWNTLGSRSEDRAPIIANFIDMKEPLNNDIYRLGDLLKIFGSVSDKYVGLQVEYGIGENINTWFSNGITVSKPPITNNVIAQWNTSTAPSSNYYTLKVTGLTADNKVNVKLIRNIYLDSTLKKGWPQKVMYETEESTSHLQIHSKYYTLFPNTLANSVEKEKITTPQTFTEDELLKQIANENPNVMQTVYYWAGMLETAVADINNDGNKEIVIYKGGVPPKILVYGQEGSLLCSKDIGDTGVDGGNLNFPLVGDLNNDSFGEIVILRTNFENSPYYSELYLIDKNCNAIPGWPLRLPSIYYGATMLMADVNLDGNKEVVLKGNSESNTDYEPNRNILLINNKGIMAKVTDLPNCSWGGSIVSSPAIGNFDDDPEMEIVSADPAPGAGGMWAGNQFVGWNNTGVIYIYNLDGSVVKGWPVYTNGVIFSSPVVGDVNNDGKQEIVVGLMYVSEVFPDTRYGGVYVFDRNGNVLQGWPYHKGYNFWSTPALGDLDSDGDLEISVSELGFVTSVLHHTGSLLTGWPMTTTWNDYYSSIMGDVTADSSVDILTTAGNGFYPWLTGHGGVEGWKKETSERDGTIRWNGITGFPKVTEVNAQAPAVIDDIDKDGKVEIIASSDYDFDATTSKYKLRGSIYVWDTEANYDSSKMPWPTFMHDPQHTGCYDCGKPRPLNCTDSDGGKNYYVKGYCIGANGIRWDDHCDPNIATNLVECYCNGINANFISTPCPYGCSNGACTCNTTKCSTTDNGDNIYTKGTDIHYDLINNTCYLLNNTDYCINQTTLWEYVNCRSSGIRNCVYGCSNGACLPRPNCIDSDNEKNYYVLGRTTGVTPSNNLFNKTDACITTKILEEYYCYNNTVYDYRYTCLYGCNNGACICTTGKDVLILDDNGRKNAFLGFYQWMNALPYSNNTVVWDILKRTIEWATNNKNASTTKIIAFGYNPTHTSLTAIRDYLVIKGYRSSNIELRGQGDINTLNSTYYQKFDLVLYAWSYPNNATNIIASGKPFITASPAHTKLIGIGTGIEAMTESRNQFYVMKNNYYPTQTYKIGPLTLPQSIWTEATQTAEKGTTLIGANNTCLK
jgi:subtilisin family serine protease